MNICKNPRIICSADLLERNAGSSGRPEAARGFKSRFMTGFGSPCGPHFADPGGSRGRSRALWNRSWMRIAWKVDFWRMSLTKSLLLEVHWTLKTTLKPPTTLAWSRIYSDCHLDAKQYRIKVKNSETIKIHHYLQYFELKPVFVARSEDPRWGSLWGQKRCKSDQIEAVEWYRNLVSW